MPVLRLRNFSGVCAISAKEPDLNKKPNGEFRHDGQISAPGARDDSNHLFSVKNSAGRFRLFVDGKPVLENGAPSSQTLPKETFQTNGPSGLLVLAHDNEGYKRISITPSPDSSLAMH